MTKRADIEEGRLVYTCNCGWIDRGHANPKSARELLEKVRQGSANPVAGQNGFRVTYSQWMGNPKTLAVGSQGDYYVPYGLSAEEQNQAALGIFQDVSHKFENLQSSFPFNMVTDSGYSQEDLVSNLVGFNAAATGQKADDIINRLCKPVSKQTALKVWDQYGDVQKNKNKEWKPVIHKCPACEEECKGEPRTFPAELGKIQPGTKGKHFFDWASRPK